MSPNPPPGDAGSPLQTAAVARRRPLRWASRALFGVVIGTWVVFLITWLSLHWLILPHIDEWREPIEARASALLGAPVRIGAITAQSGGWVPSLELRDVEVLDAEKRVALSLPRVFAALSPRSLLAFEPRFAQLLVDGPRLDVRRDAAGHIRVAGFDFGSHAAAGEDDGRVADWFFRQDEFVIRGGSVRWIDESRQAPPLVLDRVQLVVRNGLREHAMRVDATPPAGWGERFSVRGRFTQPLLARPGDWRRWTGKAYADLPRADVRELRQYVQLPFELSEGDGALRGWFEMAEGRPRSATVDLALRAVTLRLDPQVEALSFEQIEGRFDAVQRDDRISLAVRRFGFVTGDQIRWPIGSLDVAWRQRDGGDVSGGEFDADRLDIGVIAGIAGRVPIGASLRKLLAEVKPQGIVTGLSTRWEGPLDAPDRYRVKGLLSGLSLAPRPGARHDAIGRPGLSQATVRLDASESGGTAQVGITDGRIDLPGVFDDPALPVAALDASLRWTIAPPAGAASSAAPRVTVRVEQARFANADARGELTATWRSDPVQAGAAADDGRHPGELELDGRLVDAQALRAARYLPLGLPDSVRSYVGRAVRGGRIASATFRVRGDLRDFPFHDARKARDGEFRIAARIEDVSFAYVPDAIATAAGAAADRPRSAAVWPPLTAASGELVIDRSSLELRDVRARLGGVDWSGLNGRIAQLGERALFEVRGSGRGALSDMLRFVDTTPIGGWIGGALAATTGSGAADLTLALAIPLADTGATRVKGSLVLAGNDIRVTTDTPLLAGARGRVDFTQGGFAVVGAQARLLGGELRFEGGAQDGGRLRFTGQGTFDGEALRQAGELGAVAQLGSVLRGQSAYVATLGFVQGRPQIDVASPLVGMAVDLPAPFGKTAATALPLRVRTVLEDTGRAVAGAPVREALHIQLGDALQAHFVRETSAAASRVVRGAIRVSDLPGPGGSVPAVAPTLARLDETPPPLPLPAAGVAADVAVRRLDVDAWQRAGERLQGRATPPATTASPSPPVFDASGGAGYVPDTIALRVDELQAGARRLTGLTAGLSQQGGLWRANVDARELNGYLEVRPPGSGPGQPGRVLARLARLSLPKGEAEHVESLLQEQPTTLPALDIVVDELELRGRRLGRLEVVAAHRRGGADRSAAREWQLSTFNLRTPEAALTATGSFAARAGAGATPRTRLEFTLALADSGALLERFGMTRVVKGGRGSLAGEVSWPGSPLSPDYTTLSGQVKVAIDAGQFLKAGPGAARLLSVLSLQSLPRRLLLDFRDLFAEGFAFDSVEGDVGIVGGIATTNNLRMVGTAAAVLMEGRADLERETQDLRIIVIPEINAGTASLAFAIVNPALGLGTFLAQYFLRKPLMAASTREFRVSGPWDDPKVERVERPLFGGRGDAAAVDETPAAGPAGSSSAPR